jgi:hypothetical protein
VRLTSSSVTSRSASTLPEDEKKKGGLYESLFGLSSNIAKPNTNRYNAPDGKSVLRIQTILMRIRIRPLKKPEPDPDPALCKIL